MSGEPLSPELEAKVHATWDRIFAWKEGDGSERYGLKEILRAFAREIQEPLEKNRDMWRDAERGLSKAYVRLRAMIPGALDTPTGITHEQVWAITESALAASQESCRLLAEALEKIRRRVRDRAVLTSADWIEVEMICNSALWAYRSSEAGKEKA